MIDPRPMPRARLTPRRPVCRAPAAIAGPSPVVPVLRRGVLLPGVLLLGVLLLGVLLLGGCDRAGERTTALPPEPELEALIDSMLPRIAELAALEVRGPVRVERRSRDAVRAFVEERLAEEFPPDELEGLRLTYVTLGLMPDTLDLRALLLDLYAEQVVGYYDPRTGRLYLVEGVARPALRPVLVHELVHALQDQNANLDSLVASKRGNDRQTAAHAALEGHAMLVMFAYLAEAATGVPIEPELLPNPAEELEQSMEGEGTGVFQRAPAIIRRSLLFPYVAGAGFVHQLWLYRTPDQPRRPPLGELMPQSTQQVLHPVNLFILGRQDPLELRFTREPPWRARYENTLGAFETGVYLEEHLGSGAAAVADAWAGDRFRLTESPGGDAVLVWFSVWTDDAAAERFANSLRRIERDDAQRSYAIQRLDIDGMPGVRVVIHGGGGDADAVDTGTIHLFQSADGITTERFTAVGR
jgi:hypothetical protein